MSNNTTISDEEVIVFDESERENKKPEANTNEKDDDKRIYTGEIVSYNVQRQFGFIKASSKNCNGNKDVFFHKTDIINYRNLGKINVEDTCKFQIKNEQKGKKAINIKLFKEHVKKQSNKKTNQSNNRQQSINNQSKLFQDSLLKLFINASKNF
ncbi:unnamed protein product [Rotaria magnacalcarata]|uniref:CSD domain-containing protein n=1 Tax=Rotaria magnacalcarata TaxID=392030 RepID=A0A820RCL5_9BILA|nr:unnamed protein product [Rotaria magnacalcarata]CAF4436676.1 unnamed protein product [Rotaria magnacalcarata]